jgi:molybdopterin molybdotransferase
LALDATPLDFAETLARVLAQVRALPAESVPFAGALGRVLASDVQAPADDPTGAKSAMDGYALRAAETAAATDGAPLAFAAQAVIGAGHVAHRPLPPGQAQRIMTGALLPAGADAVVKLEDTRGLADGPFAIRAPLAQGEHVIARGARWRAGQRLLVAGTAVSPEVLGLLAALGQAQVSVRRRPRVALLALGDELVPVGEPLGPGQLHVSNLYVLEALARRAGAETVTLGIAGDDPAEITRRLATHVRAPAEGGCDIVLTLGGSHGGDFDYVEQVLGTLGTTLLVRRTRMIPAGSTMVAARDGCLVFGLPGTPVAAWCAWHALVRPALSGLLGRTPPGPPAVAATLTEPLRSRAGTMHFVPVWLALSPDGAPRATPLNDQALAERPPNLLANGLVLLEPAVTACAAGETVRAWWLVD